PVFLSCSLDKMRSESVRELERQALPQRDQSAIPRVRRIDARECVPVFKIVLMSHRPWLETPVSLEVIGACADLAPAKIKILVSHLTCPPHHLPIEQIICAELTGLRSAACVVRHHPVTKIEVENATHGPSQMTHGENFTGHAELLFQLLE